MRSLNVQSDVTTKPWVLLVDDEAFNLEILDELLSDYGYQTDCAENGREACDMLSANPDKYAVVLLDRMMPQMDGMEVTRFIKQHPQLRKIPIIMQSAKAAKQDIEMGLSEGILYYLTKPFGKNELLSIVDNASSYFFDYQELLEDFSRCEQTCEPGESLLVQSLEEARQAAFSLSRLADDPEKVVMGLYELITNAIEHGNLGVGYETKSGLSDRTEWIREIKARMALPENINKKVRVDCQLEEGNLVFNISDDGDGFNYRDYLEVSTARCLNTTGRGIAIARVLCFDKLEYASPGNQVTAITKAKSNSE